MKKIFSIFACLMFTICSFAQTIPASGRAQNLTATRSLTIGSKLINGVSDDTLLTTKSGSKLITEKAVKGYVDANNFGANVKIYGAKGNGVTNDRTFLQNAINANANGKLNIPDGVYIVDSTVTISSPIEIVLSKNAIIKTVTITIAKNYNLFRINASNVSITGGTLQSTFEAITQTISFTNGSNVGTVSSALPSKYNGMAFQVYDKHTGDESYISTISTTTNYRNNSANLPTGAAGTISGTSVSFTGGNVTANFTALPFSIFYGNSALIRVSTGIDKININNVVFKDCDTGIDFGDNVANPATNVIVQNCLFENSSHYGINCFRLQANATTPLNWNFLNNTFINCKRAIQLAEIREAVISGNKFYKIKEASIRAASCSHFKINDNVYNGKTIQTGVGSANFEGGTLLACEPISFSVISNNASYGAFQREKIIGSNNVVSGNLFKDALFEGVYLGNDCNFNSNTIHNVTFPIILSLFSGNISNNVVNASNCFANDWYGAFTIYTMPSLGNFRVRIEGNQFVTNRRFFFRGNTGINILYDIVNNVITGGIDGTLFQFDNAGNIRVQNNTIDVTHQVGDWFIGVTGSHTTGTNAGNYFVSSYANTQF